MGAVSVPGGNETSRGLVSFLEPNISVVLFGFLGAYFFSLQMLFRRFVVNDLRAKAYISVSIRIILAVIGARVPESIPGAADNTTIEGYLPLMAFVIGVFPPVLWRYVRTVLSKILCARVPDFENNPAARRLYERVGFVSKGTERFPYLRWLIGFSASTTLEYNIANFHGTAPLIHDCKNRKAALWAGDPLCL